MRTCLYLKGHSASVLCCLSVLEFHTRHEVSDFTMHSGAPHKLVNLHCFVRQSVLVPKGTSWCVYVHLEIYVQVLQSLFKTRLSIFFWSSNSEMHLILLSYSLTAAFLIKSQHFANLTLISAQADFKHTFLKPFKFFMSTLILNNAPGLRVPCTIYSISSLRFSSKSEQTWCNRTGLTRAKPNVVTRPTSWHQVSAPLCITAIYILKLQCSKEPRWEKEFQRFNSLTEEYRANFHLFFFHFLSHLLHQVPARVLLLAPLMCGVIICCLRNGCHTYCNLHFHTLWVYCNSS